MWLNRFWTGVFNEFLVVEFHAQRPIAIGINLITLLTSQIGPTIIFQDYL
tara:strand:+ start:237 stop:386 length:150 start_codon:yes stop_codon:yes gene_type:complete